MDRFGLDGSVDLLMRQEAVGITWPEIVAQAVARCHDHGRTVLAVDGWDKWTNLIGDAENRAGDVLAAVEPLSAGAPPSRLLPPPISQMGENSFGEATRLL
jgi:hypothetical protein